jgi:hypothetical protein
MHFPENEENSLGPISNLDDAKRYGPVGAALRSIFSETGDVDDFSSHVKESIADIDAALLDAAAKSRLRLHDNAYDLLDARDLLADEDGKLDAAEFSIADATENVAVANEVLKGHVKARENLDQSLEIIARTRALVQMFSRAEAMIAARNFHAALRMIDRLDSAVLSSQDGQVLLDVVPSSAPLRAEINAHVRRSLHAWLTAVRTELPAIGAHALSLALQDASSRIKSTASVSASAASAATEGPLSAESQKAVWIPRIREDDRTAAAGSSGRRMPRTSSVASARPRGAHEANELGHAMPGSSGNPTVGRQRRRDLRDDGDAAPAISMRPLLTCILACRDMDRMAEFAEDYERERTNQLGAGIDNISSFNALSKSSSGASSASKLADQHAALVAYVAGFFVSECAVEFHADMRLLRDVTAVELWRFARDRLAKLSSAISSHGESSTSRHVKKAEIALARLARIYNLDESHL